MSDLIRQYSSIQPEFTAESGWVILDSKQAAIKKRIESVGLPLKHWEIQINYGIKTGYNEAFIISGAKRKALIEKCSKSAEIIRPILRGRDIQKYYHDTPDLYLLFIPWHFPLQDDQTINGVSEEAEITFQNEYPAIYEHLLKYKDQLLLRNKAETGIRYEWYALQRFGAQYWRDFESPKIIYPEITKFINFTFDETDHYFVNNKCFIMTGKHLEFLTCFLNSKLFRYCFLNHFPELLGGTRELRKIFLQEIPVKTVDDLENEKYKSAIKRILLEKSQKRDSTKMEEEVNQMIFRTYELSEDEIAVINAFDKIWKNS